MSVPRYIKRVIGEIPNPRGPGAMNTFSAVGDVNWDGLLDFVVCGRNGKMAWLENQGPDRPWDVHLISVETGMECGGTLVDLTGNGYLDIINGSDYQSDEIYWWENPGPTGGVWRRRLILKTGHGQFHDTLVGDVTNEGRLSLVFTNQLGGTDIYYIPLPNEPRTSPWTRVRLVARGKTESNPFHPWNKAGLQPEEGLAFGDLDGDGLNELVCGTHWYKFQQGAWHGHKFALGYITTKVAIADIDHDGRNEIVLSEGDPCLYGRQAGGKLAWFKPGNDLRGLWVEHRVDEGLLDVHSLQLANLCGNGRLDIFTGEVGAIDAQTDQYLNRPPRLLVYENDGTGQFTRHILDEGTGTHEAVLVDLFNSGNLDIIGKPLHGPEKWKVHVWSRIE